MIFGFSISQAGLERPDAADILRGMLASGCRAIQLQTNPDIVSRPFAHLEIVNRFEYRTIHLPYMKRSGRDAYLNTALDKLADETDAVNLTFHPIHTDSLKWLGDDFGGRVCAENMDWQKDFGQDTEDLGKVFTELPDAGWTYDVNHILTNDPTLRLADELYESFAPRLRQYHLSGFGGPDLPHTLLADTKQDEIINLVKDTSKPIILESLGSINLHRFQEELDYLANFFDF